MGFTAHHVFDLACAQSAAANGEIQAWVQSYLRTGAWANTALADGLLLEQRWWAGPIELGLESLIRVVGPEPGMEFQIPSDSWFQKVGRIERELTRLENLPPLIAEFRPEGLSVRDGNHRLAAISNKGWPSCWVIVWCNSEADHAAMLKRHAETA